MVRLSNHVRRTLTSFTAWFNPPLALIDFPLDFKFQFPKPQVMNNRFLPAETAPPQVY